MTKYRIYFEIYGKKMKTIVEANSEFEAKQFVKDKLLITSCEKYDKTWEEIEKGMDKISEIMGLKNDKRG